LHRPRLFYTDQHEFPLPPGHKFPLAKYRLLRERLAATGRFEFSRAPQADPAVIELVHDQAYVRAFLGGTIDPRAMRRIGFPWSEALVRRTLASAGGTLAATEEALERSWGGTLAGGTHHALRAEGAGFCVFNDIAIAAAALRRSGGVQRIAVVDLDVHQGDGTAELLKDSLTISVHAENNFPFRKQKSAIDIELPDGAADDTYLNAIDSAVAAVMHYEPEIVFYQSGVDGLATDRLGRLALTHEGLRERDRRVFEMCLALGCPIVVTLGGGYSEPIDHTVEAHANTFLTAATIFSQRSGGGAQL
jgi:acetoin utilization deacetylase AcuC-like enzyme